MKYTLVVVCALSMSCMTVQCMEKAKTPIDASPLIGNGDVGDIENGAISTDDYAGAGRPADLGKGLIKETNIGSKKSQCRSKMCQCRCPGILEDTKDKCFYGSLIFMCCMSFGVYFYHHAHAANDYDPVPDAEESATIAANITQLIKKME